MQDGPFGDNASSIVDQKRCVHRDLAPVYHTTFIHVSIAAASEIENPLAVERWFTASDKLEVGGEREDVQ